MKTISFTEDIKLSKDNFINFSSLVEDFVENNFPDSNIQNEYSVASEMKNSDIPDSFIKNFIKSYE